MNISDESIFSQIFSYSSDSCADNPCGRNGACAPRDSDFLCTCDSGYYGNTCESREYTFNFNRHGGKIGISS